jgi:hypothetical protein
MDREEVGRIIEARFAAVGIANISDFARRTGIDRNTLAGLMGTGSKRSSAPSRRTINLVAAALQWQPDWHDRLLAGLEPVPDKPEEKEPEFPYRFTEEEMRELTTRAAELALEILSRRLK